MGEAPLFRLEQQALTMPNFDVRQAFVSEWMKDATLQDVVSDPDLQRLIDSDAKIKFSTAAADAQGQVVPDYILGKDGKLRKNPDKKEPSKDGSVTIELESDNKSETQAKKAANDLQRQWAKDMIQRWQNSEHHKGEPVPQEWMDLMAQPDAPQPDAPQPQQPDAPQPQQPEESQPQPEDIPAPPSGGGGGGGYRGGGGGGDGGVSHPGSRDLPPLTIDQPMKDVPGPVEPGKALQHLQEAIDRANNGGPPVKVLQYGDSHIAGGIEPKAIEQALGSVAPIDYSTKAKGGITASYPLQHSGEWLDQTLQQTNPDLVILSFGSNEGASAINKDSYEQTYQQLIDNVRQRAPNASILILGPSDGDSITGANKGNTLPGLDAVVEAQREVAAKNGLDFFDLRQSMGGPGSIEAWHDKGLTADDKLHFNSQGYQLIGQSVADHLKNGLKSHHA